MNILPTMRALLSKAEANAATLAASSAKAPGRDSRPAVTKHELDGRTVACIPKPIIPLEHDKERTVRKAATGSSQTGARQRGERSSERYRAAQADSKGDQESAKEAEKKPKAEDPNMYLGMLEEVARHLSPTEAFERPIPLTYNHLRQDLKCLLRTHSSLLRNNSARLL